LKHWFTCHSTAWCSW